LNASGSCGGICATAIPIFRLRCPTPVSTWLLSPPYWLASVRMWYDIRRQDTPSTG
jgi:hypothetical protein